MKPNVFIIGVQKAGTTSLYNWISQHPDADGHFGIKDVPVLLDFDRTKNIEWLEKEFVENKNIYIHGSVDYFFCIDVFLRNAKQYINEGAKFILILRDPYERALSSYSYGLKTGVIKETGKGNRFNMEKELKIKNSKNKNSLDKRLLLPIHYSLYADSLNKIKNVIPSEQLKILIYEELFKNSEESIIDIYKFLNLDINFKPKFKKLNVSGEQKIKGLKRMWKNEIAQKIIKPLIPYRIRSTFIKKVVELNTEPVNYTLDKSEINYLRNFFESDISNTEKILGFDLNGYHRK